MEENNFEKPLKILERHEEMELFIKINGKNTNKSYLINEFILYLIKIGKSRNTIKSYSFHIEKLLSKKTESKPKLTQRDIRNFLLGKTVNAHASIRCFLNFLEDFLNVKYIDVKYPPIFKYEEKAIETLNKEQLNKILDKIQEDHKFLTKFVFTCGMRASEPFRLKVGDINWDNFRKDNTKYALLRVSHTKSKKERLIPLSSNFTKELAEYLKQNNRVNEDDFIFNYNTDRMLRRFRRKARKLGVGDLLEINEKKRLEYINDWCMDRYIVAKATFFRKLFREACLKALGRKYTVHILRKSRATELLQKGVPLLQVRDFLGHRSLKTTERYLSSSIESLGNKIQELDF